VPTGCKLPPSFPQSSSNHCRFRWAKCSLDQLARLRNTKAIKEALQALPAGLSEVYERILDNISAEDQQLARRVFNWLACSPRPMRITELVEAIAVERGSVRLDPETKLNGTEDLLEICQSLVTVDQDVGTVVLAHFSVKEFLISPKLQHGPRSAFFINLTQTNFTVAGLCLAYLSFENFRSGPCATGQELVARFFNHPLYSYATSNWPYHAREHVSAEDWSFLSLVEHFFLEASGNFEAWTQAYEATKYPLQDSEKYLRWDFLGNNRLVYACRLGLYSTAQFLLSKGFDVNTVCTSKMKDELSMIQESQACGTPLNAACTSGSMETVDLLLKNGADINGLGGHQGLPLINAVYYGHQNNDDFRILEHLLNSGADINRSNSKINALLAAVHCRSSAAARILVKHGADITVRDDAGFSLLEWASVCGYVSEGIFSTLIDLGAASVVNPELPGGLPPGTDAYALVLASQNNFFDIAAKILKKDGEKIFGDPGFKLLIYAVCKCCANKGFYKFLQHMIAGCGSDFPGFEECVGDAAVNGHLLTLETLLNAWKRTEGNTARSTPGRPLILAAARGNKSVVEWLLKFGEVPTATDEHGWSAILAASVNKQNAILELFKSRGYSLSGSEKAVLIPSSWQPFIEWAEEVPKNVFINGATVELAAGEFFFFFFLHSAGSPLTYHRRCHRQPLGFFQPPPSAAHPQLLLRDYDHLHRLSGRLGVGFG
jgi:ankyrin repeat protein